MRYKRMKQESIEQRRETCKVRNKLGYCNVPDECCPKCKVHDYEINDLIVGLSWKEIQEKQSKKQLDTK